MIGQLALKSVTFGGKLIVKLDDLAQQAWYEAQRQLAKYRKILHRESLRLRRIGAELVGFEFTRQHHTISVIGLPLDSEAEKPIIDPMVGTRSRESTGRS